MIQHTARERTRHDSPATVEVSAEPFQVLIVEDVLPERERLAAILRRQGYLVSQASNGMEALRILENEPISLVISDWQMPVMDGLTLLKQVPQAVETAPYFMLLTGQDAACDLVAALDAGADDFIRKPFNAEELRARLQAGARIVRLRTRLQGKNQQLVDAYTREQKLNHSLQQDLCSAAQLQRTTLPADDLNINGLAFAHYFHPATGVAGDTYNIIPLGNQKIAFYHIDVAGHGVRAALLSFALSRFLGDPSSRAIELEQQADSGELQTCSPASVVAELNLRFMDKADSRNYFTMVYGILDLSNGQGTLCQAGHPHPLLVKTDGSVTPIAKGGLPVGVFMDAVFEDTEFQLDTGDKLLISSDGLESCRFANGRSLDPQTLQRLLGLGPRKSLPDQHQFLRQLVDKSLAELQAEDDISFMWLQRHSSPAPVNFC